jgi:predicted dehydrogenase
MLKAGVIGVGHLGRFHSLKYKDIKDVDFIGVYDLNIDRAKSVASECGVKVYEEMDKLIDEVDIVSIATPATNHFEIAKKVINKNVNILVEKPITKDLSEGKKILEFLKNKDLVFQVGHLERFNDVMIEGLKYIDNPKFIECNRVAPFSGRSIDIDVILDLMIHDIDLVLGVIKSEIESVEAIGIPIITDKVDMAHAKVNFKNGAVVNFNVSRVSKKIFRKMRIFQNFNYLGLDFQASTLEFAKRVQEGDKFSVINDMKSVKSEKDALLREIESFVEACKNKTKAVVSSIDAVKAMELAYLIKEKIDLKQKSL